MMAETMYAASLAPVVEPQLSSMLPATAWPGPARERGYVLALSLVFLLLLTIVGVTALRTTSLEEKMAHNIKDKNLSFQAAESALAEVESWLGTRQSQPLPNAANGLYPQDYSGNPPAWQTVDWYGTSGLQIFPNMPDGTTPGTALGYVNSQPRYIVEELGTSCRKSLKCGTSSGERLVNYRVTARATGGTAAAVSILQTTYNRTN